MNLPTWYIPALADETLMALLSDACNTANYLETVQRFETLDGSQQAELMRCNELKELIAAEFIYRQTVRLREAGIRSAQS